MRLDELIVGSAYFYRGFGESGYGIYTGETLMHRGQRCAVFDSFDGDTRALHNSMIVAAPDFHDPTWWQRLADEPLDMNDPAVRHEFGHCGTYGMRLPAQYFRHYAGELSHVRLFTKLELWTIAQLEARQIAWDFEHRGFPLASLGTFVPDFYLPDSDLYVEVTCSPRKDKARRLNKMALSHSDVQITCLHRRLLQRLGDCIDELDGPGLTAWLLANQDHMRQHGDRSFTG